MDIRLTAPNVLPNALLRVDQLQSSLALRDLLALSGGHDFLLQASNAMCAESSFGSMRLPWIVSRLDVQAIAELRASGATFASSALQQAVAGTGGAVDLLLLFSPHDVVFDAPNQCRIRFGVRVAIGGMLSLPKEPGLAKTLTPGEAVQQAINPYRQVNSLSPIGQIGQALLAAGAALSAAPPTMQTLSSPGIGFNSSHLEAGLEVTGGIRELNRHVDLGNRSSFEVSAWLGGGLLEIAAPFAAAGNPGSMTIRVAADVQQSTAKFTELSPDAALLLSFADPTGLAQTTTKRIRQRGAVALLDEVSLVGGPATASAGHLGTLVADTFPCRTGACPLNVGATVVAGRIGVRSAPDFIKGSRYGVVWSADAVRMLVRHSWEAGAFPQGITQTQVNAVKLRVDGVEQWADAISVFQLDTLDAVELEYDSNGRGDILFTRGTARVLPKLIRLQDGRELGPKDANDPIFAPSEPMPWSAMGELTDGALSASSPDLLYFQKAVTSGVTARLGRPFSEPPPDVEVSDSRLSAPAQRVALLVQ